MTHLVRNESLRGYPELVEKLGGDPECLLKKQGLNLAMIQQTDGLFRYRSFVNLLEDTALQLNCDDFGLQFSTCQDFSVLGPIALAAQRGKNLAEALQRVVKYMHVYTPAIFIRLSYIPEDERVLFTYQINLKGPIVSRQAIELSVGLACKVLDLLTQGKSKPKLVIFPYESPVSMLAHRRFFKCPIKFQQGVAGIYLNAVDMQLPIVQMDERMGDLAYDFLQSYFHEETQSLSQKVKALIKPMLMVNDCNNEAVAMALQTNVRALHRSLALENSSFIKIKDQVRKELAQVYLQQNNLKLGYIASLLGYSEQSAFSRCCQSWFGMGPREYRNKH